MDVTKQDEKDIYFEKKYGRMYESIQQGKAICWNYEGIDGSVRHQFILREIPIETERGYWFDITTPYGYGGPIITKLTEGHSKEELILNFEQAFKQYCCQQKIVSEFIRFHPIIQNANDFKLIYDIKNIRRTIGTNLKDYEDPIMEEFSKSCRKSIRQILRNGVDWKITVQPDNLETFKEIYYSTMERNRAKEFYYFDDAYFKHCLEWFGKYLLLVEVKLQSKTIAAGLCFVYGKVIHMHLSGTLSEYIYLSPAYIVRYATVLWGMENGYELVHYGGGRSNGESDSLYQFKKQFGQRTGFDYYIGEKIWNVAVYEELCNKVGADVHGELPAYREI